MPLQQETVAKNIASVFNIPECCLLENKVIGLRRLAWCQSWRKLDRSLCPTSSEEFHFVWKDSLTTHIKFFCSARKAYLLLEEKKKNTTLLFQRCFQANKAVRASQAPS